MRPVALAIAAVAIFALVARRSVSGVTSGGGLPGVETSSFDALDPQFKRQFLQLVAAMRGEGFDVQTMRTYRSPERQRYYLEQGTSSVSRSFHTVTRNGRPSAFAADVTQRGLSSLRPGDELALSRFYLELRTQARRFGLRTGGEYSRRADSPWSKYDLGWDPGHVEPANYTIAQAHSGATWTLA